MFHRILVPVDATDRSHQSLLLAKRIAKRFDASILIVRVRPFLEAQPNITTDLHALDDWAAEVRADGVICDSILDLDQSVDGIVATAKNQACDLIVMAPHHRTRLETFRHPSVTEAMMAQSPAPLLIWPEQMTEDAAMSFLESAASAIIVPLDGSELAEQALPYAEELATQYGRSIILARVASPNSMASPTLPLGQLDSQLIEEEYAAARSYLRKTRERLERRVHEPVQSMILTGAPATELLQLAEAHPDAVLVMTTHGRGRVGRTFLGSVATQLAHHAAIPLFILRPGATQQQSSMRNQDAFANSN